MKKIIVSFVLIIACLLSLAGCTKYKPQESTEEEAATVLSLSYHGRSYEVPFELYRTFFLNYKSTVDGGDNSVWQDEGRQEYIDKINTLITESICEIYSVFHLCLENDIDPFSRVVDQTIENYITASVEGGSVDGMLFSGHNGDYDAYLAKLKENNMNYSVQEILFRYAICIELLNDSFSSKSGSDGALNYTIEDVRAFYESDDCVRVIQPFFRLLTDMDKEINSEENLNAIREGMLERSDDEEALCTYLISNTVYTESLRDGVVIGRHSLDPVSYKDLTSTAFALSHHEVSALVKITNGTSDGYYLMYRVDKSDEHFEKCYDEIEEAYIANLIGEGLFAARNALAQSATATNTLLNMNYSDISME